MSTEAPSTNALQRARRRQLFYALAAIVIAGAAATLVFQYTYQLESELQGVAKQREQTVAVANRDLTAGTILAKDDLTLGPAPQGVPIDQFFDSPDLLLGQTISALILEGEAIRPQRITAFEGELRIDEVMDPSSRGVAIKLTDASAVAGNLLPGHYVDVMVTIPRDMPEGRVDWVTEAVLQGVRVLAVNQEVASTRVGVDSSAADPQGGARFVTLEVDPQEAKGLIHAAIRGTIHLALRPAENLEFTDYGPAIVTSSLIGLPEGLDQAQTERLARKRKITDRTAQAARTMEIVRIRGGKRTVDMIPAEGDEP